MTSILHVDAAQCVARSLRVVVLDYAALADELAGVALVPEQPDAGQRDLEVADGLHVIAGKNAEATGVDRERGSSPYSMQKYATRGHDDIDGNVPWQPHAGKPTRVKAAISLATLPLATFLADSSKDEYTMGG